MIDNLGRHLNQLDFDRWFLCVACQAEKRTCESTTLPRHV